MVANSSTSRTVRNLAVSCRRRAGAPHTSFFCSENTFASAGRKSLGTEVSYIDAERWANAVSIAFWIGGLPWPINVLDVAGDRDGAPVSLISFHSVSLSVQQWI
jgi:hypothetical protein